MYMGKTYNVTLPRGYLSYSAYDLWKRDKVAFRRKYYDHEKSFETVETIFGKQIAKHLEEYNIEGVERLPRAEYKVEAYLDGIKLLSYLDSFDEERIRFNEYKTGHLSKDGKVPWNAVKVLKHKQLDFYSTVLELKFGKVDDVTKLFWIETRFKTKTIEFAGHILATESRELELTGLVKCFERRIYKYEREAMRRDIIKVALEISKDYEEYTNRSKEVHVESVEGGSQEESKAKEPLPEITSAVS